MTKHFMRAASVALAAIAFAPIVFGQTLTDTPFGVAPAPPPRPGEPLRLRFELVTEIPLAGPLPENNLRIRGDRVEVAVAAGTVRTSWEAGAIPGAVETASIDSRESDGWAQDPDGRFRSRATSTGAVRTEKRCRRCKKNWRKSWVLRTTGPTIVPPLLTDNFIYFGAMDNRVYAVRKKNGHRLWESDVGERVSKRLVLWRGLPGEAVDPEPDAATGESAEDETLANGAEEHPVDTGEVEPTSLVLVVPDVASQLLALETDSGSEVAQFRLDDGGGRLVGIPLITPGGEILIARQKYKPDEGGLMVFRLRKIEDPAAPSKQTDDEESVEPPETDSSAPRPEDNEPRKKPGSTPPGGN